MVNSSVELEQTKVAEAGPAGEAVATATAATGSSSYYNLTPKAGMVGLWQLRSLITMMVRRDLLGRFRGSMMGTFWTLINPIGHMLLYTFVFSVILGVRLGNSASPSNFAIFLMAGLLPWAALSESCLRAVTAMMDNPNLVKRVVFPLEILPLVSVLSSMASELVALSLLTILSVFYLHTVHWTLIYVPLIFLSQMMFVGGICWFLSSLGVFMQDIRHAIALLLSVWMYATPIVYPASRLPENLKFLLWINPMAGMVTDFRRTMLEGLPPDWYSYAAYTTAAVVVWFAGYYFFFRIKKSFADVM